VPCRRDGGEFVRDGGEGVCSFDPVFVFDVEVFYGDVVGLFACEEVLG